MDMRKSDLPERYGIRASYAILSALLKVEKKAEKLRGKLDHAVTMIPESDMAEWVTESEKMIQRAEG